MSIVSKNDPTMRGAKKVFKYNDVVVKPALYNAKFTGGKKIMVIEDAKSAKLILNPEGNPIPWSFAIAENA